MSYKCPLCLQSITPGIQIVRYCTEHPDVPDRTIRFTEAELDNDRLAESLFCPEEGCNAHNAIGVPKGIFLSHIGCEANNPFWDEKEKKVIIPDDPDEDEGYRLKKNSLIGGREFPVTLRHWEIGMIRRLNHDPSHKYMWFPLMLFIAMANKRKEKKLSSVVTLIGDRRVGKTVLAMQAMEEQGYIPRGNKTRNIEVADYLYSRLPKKATPIQNHWFESLFLRYLLKRNLAYHFRPLGTLRVPGDLKALFIQPSSGRSTPAAAALTSQNGDGRKIKTLNPLRAFGWAIRRSKDTITYYWRAFIGKEGMPLGGDRQFRYTLLFYDSAGEVSNDAGSYLGRIMHCSDKIAILVSAPDLLGISGRERSIQVAHERFRDLLRMHLNKRVCLVITQMDLIKNEVEEGEWKIIENIAEDLDKAYDQEARNLIISWLSKRASFNKEEFSRDIKDFERIFFLWTANLPSEQGGPIGLDSSTAQFDELEDEDKEIISDTQPESYGLARFVCWCLDVNWSDINYG